MRQRPEEALQMAVMTAIGRLAPNVYAFAIPNGGLRSKLEAIRFKAMGVKRGIPDLALILSDGSTAYVELKAGKGKLRPEQKVFANFCLDRCIKWALIDDISQVKTVLEAWHELPYRPLPKSIAAQEMSL